MHLNVDNASDGNVDVGTSATALVDSAGTTITNDGAFTVDAGGTFSLISGANSFHNDGGTVTNNGTVLDRNGTFYQRGGTEIGNAVALAPATLDDDTTAATASFTFTAGFLTGTASSPGIAAGQTVTVSASPGSVNLAVSPFLNYGTVVLGDAVSGNGTLGGGNTVTLTNHGNLDAVLGGGGLRLMQLNVDNASDGTLDVATNASALMDTAGTTITNDGTFTVDAGGTFSLSSGINFVNGGGNVTLASTAQFQLNGNAGFTQDGDGTFTDTVDATTGDYGQLTGCGPGCGVAVDGELDITTVGTPAVGSTWPIINASGRSGQFATYAFGTVNYAATYPSAGVTLVVGTYTPSVSITPSVASPITAGTSVHVTAALIGATSTAGGTITYGLFSNSSCTALVQDLTPSPNTVTSGKRCRTRTRTRSTRLAPSTSRPPTPVTPATPAPFRAPALPHWSSTHFLVLRRAQRPRSPRRSRGDLERPVEEFSPSPTSPFRASGSQGSSSGRGYGWPSALCRICADPRKTCDQADRHASRYFAKPCAGFHLCGSATTNRGKRRIGSLEERPLPVVSQDDGVEELAPPPPPFVHGPDPGAPSSPSAAGRACQPPRRGWSICPRAGGWP